MKVTLNPLKPTPTTQGGGLTRTKLNLGFTIVELLIVIIVIAILATLVITAYNGVQNKAKNIKTVSAVEAWVKAINLYQADTGAWPSKSCLGDSTTYDGTGQCWDNAYWTVKTSFLTSMQPYIGQGSVPQPDTTDVNPSNGPMRGALFAANATFGPMIHFTQAGVSSCPRVGGLSISSTTQQPGGVYCIGLLRP